MAACDGHLPDPLNDQILVDRRQTHYPKHLCWKPSYTYSLVIPERSEYKKLEAIERAIHFEDFKNVYDAQSIIPNPIIEESYSTLPQGMLCSWFGIPYDSNHTWYGNVGCQVNFDEFLRIFKPKCYLVEIVQFNTTSRSRLLFTTQDLDFLSGIEQYDPLTRGGPWFRDDNGQNFYLTDCRRFNNEDFNVYKNEVEFVLMLKGNEYHALYNLSHVRPVNHSRANEQIYLDCRKYHGKKCPTPWSIDECNAMLKKLYDN